MRSATPISILLLLCFLGGCAGSRNSISQATPVNRPGPGPRVARGSIHAVVFCADGAGGFGGTTQALRENLAGTPIQVELVPWSHGRGRMLSDHLDRCNINEQGTRLARQIQALRSSRPNLPIYLIGHSAGCAVVLAATERLTPGHVERLILLAPSVSSRYDLRPALARSRMGIDAFVSESDWWVLGVNMRIFGTTDGRWSSTSGRVGFERVGTSANDLVLYARLRQHFWDPSQIPTGHRGGHYGSFEDGYLRTYVIPLLIPASNGTPVEEGPVLRPVRCLVTVQGR